MNTDELKTLFERVKERNLTKTQLEEYRDYLTNLYAMMMTELADLEKKEALFIYESQLKTDIAKKRMWRVTPEGQRLIELNRYQKATEKILSSLKSRIFAIY